MKNSISAFDGQSVEYQYFSRYTLETSFRCTRPSSGEVRSVIGRTIWALSPGDGAGKISNANAIWFGRNI
jgi:hypothetical protein